MADKRDYYEVLGISKNATEDEIKQAEKDMQDLTDKFIKQIDEMLATKEKELMTL